MARSLDRVTVTLFTVFAIFTSMPSMAHVNCEALTKLSFPEAVVISARAMPAGPLKIPLVVAAKGCESSVSHNRYSPCADVADDLPEFCRVTLRVEPQIFVEVWLPGEKAWNGRFLGVGNGGLAGWVNYTDLAWALRAGYASASTDAGHPFYMEHAFAFNADGSLNQQLISDFASRSIHEMVLKAKSLIKSYYGTPLRYSYWSGCSAGGRQGLMAVQRFPEEYDGVLAGSPAINWDRLAPSQLWPMLAVHQEVGHTIGAEKLVRVTNDAIAACDRDDGVIDGVIGNPRNCKYDPAKSICRDSNDANGCLTTSEANAIRKVWEGPKSAATGGRLWFGYERGTDLTKVAGLGPDGAPSLVAYFRDVIRQSRTFDWQSLDARQLERDMRSSYTKFNEVIGTADPDLQRWKERGGKLLVWQDEDDQAIPPRGTLNYFDRVLAANGGFDEVGKFARLYMIPGSSHCGVNVAPWGSSEHVSNRMLDALVAWVERGRVPDQIIASRKLTDGTVSARPLCPFPASARWTGQGDPKHAENFVCMKGTQNTADLAVTRFDGT